MDDRFDPVLTAALLGFEGEAGRYCEGISDIAAREYAVDYTRMVRNRAIGVQPAFPHVPPGLFGPNVNLIRTTLERMWQKYSA